MAKNNGAALCPNVDAWKADPRFQSVKEIYASREMTDKALAYAIQLYRERYKDTLIAKGIDPEEWFPLESTDRAAFTKFLNHRLSVERFRKTESEIELREVEDTYNFLNNAFVGTLDDRVNFIANRFFQWLNRQEVEQQKSAREIMEKEHEPGVHTLRWGLNKIFDKIKKMLYEQTVKVEELKKKESLTDGEKIELAKAEHLVQEYNTILEHKGRLAAMAALQIADTLGMKVNIRTLEMRFDDISPDTEVADSGEEGDENRQEEDGTEVEEGSKGDRYGDYRVMKLRESLSPEVRKFYKSLHNIGLDGQYDVDDIGEERFLDDAYVAVAMREILENYDPDRDGALRDYILQFADEHAFVKEMSEKLKAMPYMEQKIFSAQKQVKRLAAYTKQEKQGYKTYVANKITRTSAIRNIANNWIGGHVLYGPFSYYGTDKMMVPKEKFDEIRKRPEDVDKAINELSNIKITIKAPSYSEESRRNILPHPATKARTETRVDSRGNRYEKIVETAKPAGGYEGVRPEFFDDTELWMKDWLKRNDATLTWLEHRMKGLGIEISKEDLKKLALRKVGDSKLFEEKRKYGGNAGNNNSLYRIIYAIEEFDKEIEDKYNTQSLDKRASTFINTDYIGYAGLFAKRLMTAGLFQDAVDDRFVDEGKSMSSYKNRSLMDDVVEVLNSGDESAYEEHFYKYEGFAIGKGESRTIPFRYGLSPVSIYDGLSFNHVPYEKLSKRQKLTNAWKFFSSLGAVEANIMSDYSTGYCFLTGFGPQSEITVNVGEILEGEKEDKLKSLYKKYDDILPLTGNINDQNGRAYQGLEGQTVGKVISLRVDRETLDSMVLQGMIDPMEAAKAVASFEREYSRIMNTYAVSAESGTAKLKQQYALKGLVFGEDGNPISPTAVDSPNAGKNALYREYNEEMKYLSDNPNHKKEEEENRTSFGLTYVRNGKKYYSGVVDDFVNEVLLEMDVMAATKERMKDPKRAELTVMEKENLSFHIFPEFNGEEFKKGLAKCLTSEETKEYLRDQVTQQLEKIIAKDIATLESNGVLSNKNTFGNNAPESGKFSDMPKGTQNSLVAFSVETFYARLQMCKAFTGSLSQFNGLLDYEKRNMLVHAPRQAMYTQAGFFENASASTQNVVYLGDEISSSAVIDDFKNSLKQLYDAKLIDEKTYNMYVDAYNNIKVTDGQGFRTLESYRQVMNMSGRWTTKHEYAYKRLIKGKPRKKDLMLLLEINKPVLSGYEEIEAAEGDLQKPIRATVLHKYSEIVLLPQALTKYCLQGSSPMMEAMSMAQEALASNGIKVDLFLMHSGVKEGAHSVIKPFMKWKDVKGEKQEGETQEQADERERRTRGWNGEPLTDRVFKTSKAMADCIVNSVLSNPHTVHNFSYKYYGKAASMTPHEGHDAIAIAAQAEKVLFSNITSSDSYIRVGNKDLTAKEARDFYFDLKTADIVEQWNSLREIFQSSDKLEEIFRTELISRGYTSREFEYALAHLKKGTFAIPLYSPNVTKVVQEILQSIIRNRLLKEKHSGTNLPQSTSLGLDLESVTETDKKKLRVVWEGEGKDRRIKYVEVYIPLSGDFSKLAQFADENGNISEDRLNDLVKEGYIDEELLYFIGYRTPSDAPHSVIPCKIKGFIGGVEGASIRMPKEIMSMTGHDYDGDKLRCHFKEFNMVDRDQATDVDRVKVILGQEKASVLSSARVEKYDYSKGMFDNNVRARHNAKLDIMFSRITTPEGTRQMIMSGGAGRMTNIAKAFEIMRFVHQNESAREPFISAMTEVGMSKIDEKERTEQKRKAIERRSLYLIDREDELYDALMTLSAKEISSVLSAIKSSESPFSLTHSVDAFEYIMGGSEMISIYAMYNASLAMLQRMDIRYNPRYTESKSKNGKIQEPKRYDIVVFGQEIGKLCDVKTKEGRLASTIPSNLLNAAVDNGKDPILSYLNQNPQMAEVTMFLCAAGYDDENIMILLNQPVMRKLAERLADNDSGGFNAEAYNIIKELLNVCSPALNEKVVNGDGQYRRYASLQRLRENSEGEEGKKRFLRHTAKSYDEVRSINVESSGEVTQDKMLNGEDDVLDQIDVLLMFTEISTTADQFSDIIRALRPDSEGGSTGSSLYSHIAKLAQLRKVRAGLADGRLSGFEAILGTGEEVIGDGWSNERIMHEVKSKPKDVEGEILPEVRALNLLMVENGLNFYDNIFPQAHPDWVDLCLEIAEKYGYKKVQDGTVKKIMENMILWKLLKDKNFVKGEVSDDQEKIVYSVPKAVRALKARVAEAIDHPEKDPAAAKLYGNIFLKNLSTSEIGDEGNNVGEKEPPERLRFMLNGPAVSGMTDRIKEAWHQMLYSEDKEIRQLAIDLFKYNMYTNGFSYGMYEFAHFAPFSVVMAVPGYIDALDKVINTDWRDDVDRENFINQYYMNHWGDKKFLQWIELSKDNVQPSSEIGKYEVVDSSLAQKISNERYIVGLENKEQTLYRVVLQSGADNKLHCYLVESVKAGRRNARGQSLTQMNPRVSYLDFTPQIPATASYFTQAKKETKTTDPFESSEASYRAAVADKGTATMDSVLSFFGLIGTDKGRQMVDDQESKAEQAAQRREDRENKQSTEERQETTSNGPTDEEIQAADNFFFSIAKKGPDGKYEVVDVPATPENIQEARRQKAFVKLNRKLRDMMKRLGISDGVLSDTEIRMQINGITDFDTARVTAEGLLELIRLREGAEGEYALPEEFSHMSLEMLGYDHHLVKRLINAIANDEALLKEIFGDQYDTYAEEYKGNKEKLIIEAAGKLVAKQMFLHESKSSLRKLIDRIIDAIYDLIGRFSKREIEDAIFDAEETASKIARDMLAGRLLDNMSLENVISSGAFYSKATQVQEDISDKEDILHKLLKIDMKRLDTLKKRAGHVGQKKTPESISNTSFMITQLERAIRTGKTEAAVLSYIKNTFAFLKKNEKGFDSAVSAGLPVNRLCKRLEVSRDMLSSFAQSMAAIKQAMDSGELPKSMELVTTYNAVNSLATELESKYDYYGNVYFKDMLAGVYGKDGVTVTIGKEKGRHITLDEMTTKSDGDVSFFSRWVHSVSDCKDYVLKAIGEVVRNAKIAGRRRADKYRRQIDVMFADYVRETGSKDTSFIFEMARYDGGKWCNGLSDDGKLHKTGKYISAEAAKSLSEPQQKFYNSFMKIKKQLDKFVPEGLVQKDGRGIVLLSRELLDRARHSGNPGETIWDSIKYSVLESPEKISHEYQNIEVDFDDNAVDMLPVRLLKKGKNTLYDEMSDDAATSLVAYAGMACEYDEMNNVIGVLENAKYMNSQREVIQKSGRRKKREVHENEQYRFNKVFTKKLMYTRLQQMTDDYFQMHVYGHMEKEEGTVGNTSISKRKLANLANRLSSWTQMALNLPQRISNVTTGGMMIMIESVGKGVYNMKDVAKASAIWAANAPDRLTDIGNENYDNFLSLFADHFDIHQNNSVTRKNYEKSRISKTINTNLLYSGLMIGEDYLALVTALSVAMNIKTKNQKTGEIGNLIDAYEVKYEDPEHKVGAYLGLKDGYTLEDGSAITEEFERKYQKKVIGLNFKLQGIYNEDDKSAIHSVAFGALVMMYRKWVAPALKRRYDGVDYNILSGEYEEGYHTTMFRVLGKIMSDTKSQVTEGKSAAALWNIIEDLRALGNSISVNWNELEDYEKSNIRKSIFEIAVVVGLSAACALMGKIKPSKNYDDDDEEKKLTWWDKTLYSQILRLRTEVASQAPTPLMFDEAMHILRSPFAALRTIQSTINILHLMIPSNYLEEIKSGRYKGHTKAYKYFHEMPIIGMWKKVENFVDPTPMINYYKNDVAI